MIDESSQDDYSAFFQPISSLPIQRQDGWDKPNSRSLKKYPDRVRLANLVCRRKGRTVIGVVLHGDTVSTTEGTLERLGQDFYADCPCDVSHAIDGDLLQRATRSLPDRSRRSKPPEINVRHVERRRVPGPEVD